MGMPIRSGLRPSRHAVLAAVLAVVLEGTSGCEPTGREQHAPLALAVRVGADSFPITRLHVERPATAKVWVSRVDPARNLIPSSPAPEPGEPAPDPLDSPAPPALEVREGLKPPLLRTSDPLRLPRLGSNASVELDVHVDEAGVVTEALWVGGSADTAGASAAARCALSMRFYPALMSGRPIAVWCRQRFDFNTR